MDEVGEAGMITGIAFYKAGSDMTRNIAIYLAHTDRDSFASGNGWQWDWINVDESNLVFNGSVEFHSGMWTSITFQTPFVYDGMSNLALVVDDNTLIPTTIPPESMEMLAFETDQKQAIYISGTTNWNPLSPQWGGKTVNVKNQIRLFKTGRNRLNSRWMRLRVTK